MFPREMRIECGEHVSRLDHNARPFSFSSERKTRHLLRLMDSPITHLRCCKLEKRSASGGGREQSAFVNCTAMTADAKTKVSPPSPPYRQRRSSLATITSCVYVSCHPVAAWLRHVVSAMMRKRITRWIGIRLRRWFARFVRHANRSPERAPRARHL